MQCLILRGFLLKYYMLKGKIIDKSKIQKKKNTINSSSKAKEAPLRTEKQGKINMIQKRT